MAPGHWYLRLVKRDNSPLGRPGGITEWLKNKTGGLVVTDSVVLQERCSFCWRGSPVSKVSDHGAEKCPLLVTFNKYRANANLQPVRIGEGSIYAEAKKEPIKAETVAKELAKEVKDLKGCIVGLEKRLQVLEKKAGVKRKASDDPAAKQSKKRKSSGGESSGAGGTKSPSPGTEKEKGKKSKKGKDKAPK